MSHYQATCEVSVKVRSRWVRAANEAEAAKKIADNIRHWASRALDVAESEVFVQVGKSTEVDQ